MTDNEILLQDRLDKIRQVIDQYGEENFCLSFSGGKDSTVLSALIDTTCPVNIKYIDTGYMPDLDIALSGDGTLNYAGLVDDLTHNADRYDIVFGEALSATLKGPTLVLANRVEYLQQMQEDMRGCGRRSLCLSAMGMSKKAKETRREALRQLNNGELECILATYQLAKEGLDVPNLRYVVFATPEKDDTTVTQAAGRVGRKAEGKDHGTVIDIVDDFGMLRCWQRQRENIYKKLGYEVSKDVL